MADDGETKSLSGPGISMADLEYLARDELRPLRLALEFSRVDRALDQHGIASTIVVFGSSRVPRPEVKDDPAAAKPLVSDEREADRVKLDWRAWYETARAFGQIVSERGGALHPEAGQRQNVIVTGGGPGLMEAANRGAFEAGAPSVGFNIALPAGQQPNSYTTPALTFEFHYFALRKMHFAMRANALAVFPGGLGTLDELFEILTLKQVRKSAPMPVLLFCRKYWHSVVRFDALADFGMIAPEDLSLFDMVDTAEEGWDVLVQRGLTLRTPLRES